MPAEAQRSRSVIPPSAPPSDYSQHELHPSQPWIPPSRHGQHGNHKQHTTSSLHCKENVPKIRHKEEVSAGCDGVEGGQCISVSIHSNHVPYSGQSSRTQHTHRRDKHRHHVTDRRDYFSPEASDYETFDWSQQDGPCTSRDYQSLKKKQARKDVEYNSQKYYNVDTVQATVELASPKVRKSSKKGSRKQSKSRPVEHVEHSSVLPPQTPPDVHTRDEVLSTSGGVRSATEEVLLKHSEFLERSRQGAALPYSETTSQKTQVVRAKVLPESKKAEVIRVEGTATKVKQPDTTTEQVVRTTVQTHSQKPEPTEDSVTKLKQPDSATGVTQTNVPEKKTSESGVPDNKKEEELSEDDHSETASRATSRGRHPLTKTVYYQNRFITVPVDPESAEGRQLLAREAGEDLTDTAEDAMVRDEPKRGLLDRAPPAVLKCFALLRDDRMANASSEMREKMEVINSPPEGDSILRKILNFIFVTTGVVLLLGVVLVIVYTSFGGKQAEEFLKKATDHLTGVKNFGDSYPEPEPGEEVSTAIPEIIDNIPDTIELHDVGSHDFVDHYRVEIDYGGYDDSAHAPRGNQPAPADTPSPPANYEDYQIKTVDYHDDGDYGATVVRRREEEDASDEGHVDNNKPAPEVAPVRDEHRAEHPVDVNVKWKISSSKSRGDRDKHKKKRDRKRDRKREHRKRQRARKRQREQQRRLDEEKDGPHRHRRHHRRKMERRFPSGLYP